MNELKPEDVMRALEMCKSCRDLQPCDVCPYFRAELGDDESCVNRMAQDALALLREKDAEIKELTDDNEWSAKRIIETDKLVSILKAEVERLNKKQESVSSVCNSAMEHYDALYEQAKEILKAEARADAITEFAEKLKEAVKYIPWCDYPPVHNCIEEIAEKLKGETDGETYL